MTVNKRVSLPSSNYTLSQSMTETESLRDLDAFAAEHTGEGGVGGGGGTAATTTFDPAAGIEATDVQAAIEELATDVSSIPISDPDPYGLLSDSDALFADEFDDASIDADWVLTQPSSGTITAGEGNHKLSLSCTATSDYGLFSRPLSSFGGAWSDGVTILEAAWTAGKGVNGIIRANFCVTNGTGLGATAAQISVGQGGGSSGTPLVYTFLGTPAAPFGGGYVDCGNWFDEVRGRIVSLGAGSVGMQLSVNGTDWVTIGSPVSIGFTPTHVGWIFGSNNGMAAFGADYVRRIA